MGGSNLQTPGKKGAPLEPDGPDHPVHSKTPTTGRIIWKTQHVLPQYDIRCHPCTAFTACPPLLVPIRESSSPFPPHPRAGDSSWGDLRISYPGGPWSARRNAHSLDLIPQPGRGGIGAISMSPQPCRTGVGVWTQEMVQDADV